MLAFAAKHGPNHASNRRNSRSVLKAKTISNTLQFSCQTLQITTAPKDGQALASASSMDILHLLCFTGFFGYCLAFPTETLQNAKSDGDSHSKLGLDLCPTCLQFSSEAIDDLLNIVLNAGVIGTCGDLCGLLEQKTGKQWIGAVCNILCDVAGVELFVNLIDRVDIDPIYYCELLTVCPIKDDGDATISMLSVKPPVGKQGTKFALDVNWTTINGTGTGEIYIGVETVDGVPLEDSFLNEVTAPGTYTSKVTISTKVDPNCDPTQGPCEQWLPGNYTIIYAICNGECGSKHPHSQVYDQKSTVFTIDG